MRGTTCCEQDASLAIIRRALRFERIVANADVLTTTYSHDANGNLVQAGGWTYMWDYLNRMLATGYANSTTTYAYDPSGARVLQTSTTSTTYYPNKYYSFTSTKIGANTYATSTNYIWNGDTLLATIDQKLYNGAATGSPITRYIHPDHLGSTNAVTDQNGSLVQLLDYYPYGATRISTSSYPTNEKRQYIDQFTDTQSGLSYLNARYYDGQRGQFISQDPAFIQLGVPSQIQQLINRNQQQVLADPQLINAYSYGSDNPIRNTDPSGNGILEGTISGGALIGGFFGVDIDTTNRGMQLILGPSVGPSIGGKLQGSWDPNATLDPGGAYYQTQANVSVLAGRSATRQAPINVFDPKQPLLGPQTDTSWAWSFGFNIGVTNAILLKSDPYYFANSNRASTQVNWKALSGYSIGPLSNSVVNYASTAGANLKDPGFAAALRQINFASAPWLATSVSTPSTIKSK